MKDDRQLLKNIKKKGEKKRNISVIYILIMKKTDFDINGFILKREIPWTLYGVSSCKKKNIKA